jgi:flagellar hook-associated protein 3 FlgL|tara:strand:- start:6707 stop:7648 length:942 start_codon:yes stop_codon:yes gene_type:complete
MRIATSSWYRHQTETMLDKQAKIAGLQEQIATGRRFTSASADPAAAQRADTIKRAISDNDQALRNSASVTERLQASGLALEGMSDIMQRMNELAISASSDTLSGDDRRTIAVEIDQLKAQFLQLSNARSADGTYVFSGGASGTPAFAAQPDGSVRYEGSGKAIRVPVGAGNLVAAGDAADSFLVRPDGEGGDTSVFDLFDQFSGLMRAGDPDGETPEQRAARHAGMEDMLVQLKSSTDGIFDVQAAQGSRLSVLESEERRLEDMSVDLEATRSTLEDTDVTAAIVDLERYATILKAIQASFGKVASLSLFDRL